MMDSGFDDRRRVARLLAGDEEAFEAFVDDFYPRLYRFAWPRAGRDPQAAEDIVQATFQKVIPKLSEYRGEAALFTWLCSFCRFEIAAFWRARGERALEMPEDAPAVRAALESLATTIEGPEDALQRKEIGRLVRVALDALPVRYGNALEWKYLQGHSVAEIARRLETTEKAAESLLTRSRDAFREAFGELAGEWRTR